MDLTKLQQIVEIHRPAALFSSLPFAIEDRGEQKVRWFVYNMTFDKPNELSVQRIYTMDQDERIEIIINPNLRFQLTNDDQEDSPNTYKDFDHDYYYEQFALAFNSNDHAALNNLLCSSESLSSLLVYKAIRNYKSN